MVHLQFRVNSHFSESSNIIAGDLEGWFLHYKFQPGSEDEFYVPLSEVVEDVVAGDVIWFILNYQLLGAAPILRVEEDVFNDRTEIWYRGTDIIEYKEDINPRLSAQIASGELWEAIKK